MTEYATADLGVQVVSGEIAPAEPGRRTLIKAALAWSVLALWQAEPLVAEEITMVEKKKTGSAPSGVLTYDDVRSVSPALKHHTKAVLLDGVWMRPQLSARDRSVVTVAALIARIQIIEMPLHFALALDNGVKPAELSEIITHLAFYAGWVNTMSAVAVAKDIFHQRGIGIDQLPPVKDKLLPLNEDAEKQRATQVGNNFGEVSAGLVPHNRRSLSRPVAAPCARTARSKSCHCKRTDRKRPDRPNHLPPGSCHG